MDFFNELLCIIVFMQFIIIFYDNNILNCYVNFSEMRIEEKMELFHVDSFT